jgi:dephospho-CoA kinase
MVFYCVVGKLCSGKSMFIDYCKDYYNFDIIDFKENNIDYNQLDENNGFEKIK